LQDPAAVYRYGWNYPPAVTLAARIVPDPAICWKVMTSPTALIVSAGG
jgi:hypothetical protein